MLPLLRGSSAARIVNLTSDLGSLHHATAGDHPLGPLPPMLAYNSSKTAVNALTVTYANELREDGILVNAASPGIVATDLNGHQGMLSPEQGARIPVDMATLGDGGPTGTFRAEDGTPEGRPRGDCRTARPGARTRSFGPTAAPGTSRIVMTRKPGRDRVARSRPACAAGADRRCAWRVGCCRRAGGR